MNNSESSLTLEKFQEAIDLLFPILYYVTDKNMEPGFLYLCEETDLSPEFIVCHPDDFETIKSKITARRLVHIKDEPIEKSYERLLKRFKPVSPSYFDIKGV